jgi:hypothetical protein
MLGSMLRMGAPVQDVLAASEEAGRQLVMEGRMSEGTLGIVSRELVSLESFVQGINQRMQKVLEAV